MPSSSSTNAPYAVKLRTLPLTFEPTGKRLVLDVDREDDDLNLVADGEHVARAGDALGPAELGDVDETLDAGGDLDERAVGGEVDDLALHARADRELVLDGVPRIGHGLL